MSARDDNRDYAEEAHNQALLDNPNDEPETGLYVNVYEVERCYGGPEEGGWWFNAGDPVVSYGPFARADAHEVLSHQEAFAWATNLNRRSMYSVIGDANQRVEIETHEARAFPSECPQYC